MRRRIAGILTTGAAIAAATALAATSASAAQQSITVDNPNADGSYTAHSDFVTLTDQSSGISFDCTSSDSDGLIPSDSYTTPADVGDINVDFNNCNGPLGPVTATPNDQPYDLVVTSYDADAGDDGQGFGYIGPVNVHVAMPGCDFDVVGNAPGHYDNATHTLTVGGTLPDGVAPLEPINIVGCLGLVNPGDELTYEGDYLVTDPVGPSITITSP